jgi:hypothetical protein
MDTDFKRIIKEIADEMGQNVPEYTNINDAQTYYEMLMGEQSISDRMFSAIDYAFGIYFGYKLGRKKNSRECNSYWIVSKTFGAKPPEGDIHWVGPYNSKQEAERYLDRFPKSRFDANEDCYGSDLLVMDDMQLIAAVSKMGAAPVSGRSAVGLKDMAWDFDTLESEVRKAYPEQYNSRQNNSEAASLLQRLKSICLGTGFTPAYDSEYERIELVSNGLIYVIENEENEIVLMDYDEKVLFKSENIDEVLDEVKKVLKGQRSQNGRDAQKEYAFLMLSYDTPEFIKNLQNEIPAEELYVGAEGEEDRYGLETQSHISVLPCLSNSTKLNDLIPQLPELSTLGANLVNISVFECDDYDVLKADVMFDSPIAGLHDELDKEFKTHSEYEFHPHMTIAYMQKGKATQYAKELSEPVYVVPKSYAYSFWTKGKMKEVYFS